MTMIRTIGPGPACRCRRALRRSPVLGAARCGAGTPGRARPVRLIVSLRGGRRDRRRRAHAWPEAVASVWGQPVVIENRAGAGGNFGADVVAKSPADGLHTAVRVGQYYDQSAHSTRRMPFDTEKDLVPITNVASGPMLVVVPDAFAGQRTSRIWSRWRNRNQAPSTSARPAWAARCTWPAKVSPTPHAVEITHVPYKGEAVAYNDLIARPDPDDGRQFRRGVRARWAIGRLRALAVTGKTALAACCPTCPPSPRAACRASRTSAGSACSRQPARPRTCVARSNATPQALGDTERQGAPVRAGHEAGGQQPGRVRGGDQTRKTSAGPPWSRTASWPPTESIEHQMKIDLHAVEEAAKALYIRALKVLPPDIKQGFGRLQPVRPMQRQARTGDDDDQHRRWRKTPTTCCARTRAFRSTTSRSAAAWRSTAMR